MAGTRQGGLNAARTNKNRHGADFYTKLGSKGESVRHPETRMFRVNPELARQAGAKGGKISKRRRASDYL